MIIMLNITTLWGSQVIQMCMPCEVLYMESDCRGSGDHHNIRMNEHIHV